jgi:hypothetical protein
MLKLTFLITTYSNPAETNVSDYDTFELGLLFEQLISNIRIIKLTVTVRIIDYSNNFM